jgi:hypothetical protein
MPCRVEAAGGAYAVDDADIGKPGSCQNEAWLSYATSRDFVGVTSPACVVKIGIPVEFTALYQRSRAGEVWTTAPSGQAKIVPIDNDKFAFSLASGLLGLGNEDCQRLRQHAADVQIRERFSYPCQCRLAS